MFLSVKEARENSIRDKIERFDGGADIKLVPPIQTFTFSFEKFGSSVKLSTCEIKATEICSLRYNTANTCQNRLHATVSEQNHNYFVELDELSARWGNSGV